ncbi:MAG: hypothetical protein HY318_16355 [Armatimonadetes bacterium]|nr:hypothetical protein [Armatimonadota bacterium]
MPSTQTLLYPDTLFHEVFLRSIQGAHEGIEIATFVFKTNYGAAAPSDAIRDVLKAAA